MGALASGRNRRPKVNKSHWPLPLLVVTGHVGAGLFKPRKNLISFKSNITKFLYRGIPIFPQTSKNESIEAITEIINTPDRTPELINTYLSKQSNKISSLKDIILDRYETIIAHDLIAPSWTAIYDGFTKKGKYIDEALSDFISHNIDKLSVATQDIEHKKAQLLFEVFLGNDIIQSIEVFQKLQSKFPLQFEDYDLKEQRKDKMEVLISKKTIKYNDYYHSHISEYFPDLLPLYIISNINDFIPAPNELNIDSVVLTKLLQSPKINKAQKIQIIERITPSLLYTDSDVADEVCLQLLEIDKNTTIDVDLLANIVRKSNDNEAKLKCVIQKLQHTTYDQSIVDKLLLALGDPYAKIPKRKGVAKIPNNKSNRTILGYLRKNQYKDLSNPTTLPKEKDGYFILHTKRM